MANTWGGTPPRAANSDLFGRRWFLAGGNVILFVGLIIGGAAKSNQAMYAGMALAGFGAGNSQLGAFALPELLPNKWRHIGVVLADLGVFVAVVIGPIGGRFAAVHGDAVSRRMGLPVFFLFVVRYFWGPPADT